MGTWQPPPSVARTARSASTPKRVAVSSSLAHERAASLASRVSMASAPCPTAGHITSTGRLSAMRASQPRRRKPAAAITTLVLLGQVLELRARQATGSAIRALLRLAPKNTRLITSWIMELSRSVVC